MINICLVGFGKMNKEVYEVISSDRDVKIISILEPNPQKIEGVEVFSESQKAFELADLVIDFSTKEACIKNIVTASAMGKNVIIGTTGMSNNDLEKIKDVIAINKTSGVIAGNFSVGVNIFIETAKQLHEKLPKYEMEIIEVHHNQKKDAPSGTALRTLVALGKTKEEITVHCLRMGDVIGDHSVIFAGNSERIELTHRATSRKCFAQGALMAAKWVASKKDGTLHDFREVIK
ncbi:MAG: 4-hydroxy-tetrahydrodipicolinate reductase [Candidatus Micrarchaeota archaeon]